VLLGTTKGDAMFHHGSETWFPLSKANSVSPAAQSDDDTSREEKEDEEEVGDDPESRTEDPDEGYADSTVGSKRKRGGGI
jgi:hypothetical protein